MKIKIKKWVTGNIFILIITKEFILKYMPMLRGTNIKKHLSIIKKSKKKGN